MSVSSRRVTDGPGGEPRFHYLVRWRDDRRIEHARMFATAGQAAEFDSEIKAGRTGPRSERRRGPSPTPARRRVPGIPEEPVGRGIHWVFARLTTM
jgi:hypothetical protein